jgi:hypothetical protein
MCRSARSATPSRPTSAWRSVSCAATRAASYASSPASTSNAAYPPALASEVAQVLSRGGALERPRPRRAGTRPGPSGPALSGRVDVGAVVRGGCGGAPAQRCARPGTGAARRRRPRDLHRAGAAPRPRGTTGRCAAAPCHGPGESSGAPWRWRSPRASSARSPAPSCRCLIGNGRGRDGAPDGDKEHRGACFSRSGSCADEGGVRSLG